MDMLSKPEDSRVGTLHQSHRECAGKRCTRIIKKLSDVSLQARDDGGRHRYKAGFFNIRGDNGFLLSNKSQVMTVNNQRKVALIVIMTGRVRDGKGFSQQRDAEMCNRAWHPSRQKKEVGGQQGCCLTSKIKNQTISYKNTKCAVGSPGCDASTTPSRPYNTSVVMLEDPTDPITSEKHNTELTASSPDRITAQSPGFWSKSRPSRD